MSDSVEIMAIEKNDYFDLSVMVGELLTEIMEKIDHESFHYNQAETTNRIEKYIALDKYWVFIAKDLNSSENIGFVSMYESFALYSEGVYGTIPELYVRPNWRSQNIGCYLLNKASDFARSKNWQRLEVTTPPLPEFDRTLDFYQSHGFEIAGGRKLKVDLITK